MIRFHDPATLILTLICIVLSSAVAIIWFSKKNGFANILLLLTGIQRYGVAVGFALKPYLIFSFLLFCGSLLNRDFKYRFSKMLKMLRLVSIPFSALLISMLLSGLFTGESTESLRQYILLFWGWLIICSYMLYMERSEDILNASYVLTNIGALLAIVGLVSYGLYVMGFHFISSGREGEGLIYKYATDKIGRLRNFEWDPNAYALYILPIFFMSFGVTLYDRHRQKNVVRPAIVTALLFINLLLTFSRGALVSLIGAMGFAILYSKTRPATKAVIVVAMFSIICTGLLLNSTGFLDPLVVGFTSRSGFEEGRYYFWDKSLSLISTHLFWGIGQGRITEYLPKQAHNTWLELTAENGIIAAISMAWILGIIMWKALALYRRLAVRDDGRAYILMGGLCGLVSMVVMLASVSLISAIYFWFQIGLLLSMVYIFGTEGDVPASEGGGLDENIMP